MNMESQRLAMRPLLTHIALRVRNIERSAAFYEKYAQLSLVSMRNEPDTRVGWLGNPRVKENFVIVLLEFPFEPSEHPRFDHLGLDLPTREQVDAVAEMARLEGILELEPKYHGPVVGYFCMIRDPDGNRVEFSHGQKIGQSLNGDDPAKGLEG